MTDTQRKLINAAGFQVCWFACVLGGSLWALPAVILFMSWHQQIADRREWLLIATLTAAGTLADTLWYQIGILSFPDYDLPVIPAWLALLWLAFSATLLHSLYIFFSKAWLIAPLSAVAAPFSYYAGQRFGAIDISDGGLFIVAASWGTLMLLFSIAYHYLKPERKHV